MGLTGQTRVKRTLSPPFFSQNASVGGAPDIPEFIPWSPATLDGVKLLLPAVKATREVTCHFPPK